MAGRPRKEKVSLICENCQKPYERTVWEVAHRKCRFCSRACSSYFIGKRNKGKKPEEIDLEFAVKMYKKGWSLRRISREARYPIRRLFELLRKAVPMRRPGGGQDRIRCVDCDKRIAKGTRCPYHKKIRTAEIQRTWRRQRYKIPPGRWRLAEIE